MFEKRSKILFLSAILSIIYASFLIIYCLKIMNSLSLYESLKGKIFSIVIITHITCISLGAILLLISFVFKKRFFSFIGVFLLCIGAISYKKYILYVIPMIILGMLGFFEQKKLDDSSFNLI